MRGRRRGGLGLTGFGLGVAPRGGLRRGVAAGAARFGAGGWRGGGGAYRPAWMSATSCSNSLTRVFSSRWIFRSLGMARRPRKPWARMAWIIRWMSVAKRWAGVGLRCMGARLVSNNDAAMSRKIFLDCTEAHPCRQAHVGKRGTVGSPVGRAQSSGDAGCQGETINRPATSCLSYGRMRISTVRPSAVSQAASRSIVTLSTRPRRTFERVG